jgi:hypothetical protein
VVYEDYEELSLDVPYIPGESKLWAALKAGLDQGFFSHGFTGKNWGFGLALERILAWWQAAAVSGVHGVHELKWACCNCGPCLIPSCRLSGFQGTACVQQAPGPRKSGWRRALAAPGRSARVTSCSCVSCVCSGAQPARRAAAPVYPRSVRCVTPGPPWEVRACFHRKQPQE